MDQVDGSTATLERPDETDAQSRVRVALRAALEAELTADASDPRTDADGALMFTDT